MYQPSTPPSDEPMTLGSPYNSQSSPRDGSSGCGRGLGTCSPTVHDTTNPLLNNSVQANCNNISLAMSASASQYAPSYLLGGSQQTHKSPTSPRQDLRYGGPKSKNEYNIRNVPKPSVDRCGPPVKSLCLNESKGYAGAPDLFSDSMVVNTSYLSKSFGVVNGSVTGTPSDADAANHSTYLRRGIGSDDYMNQSSFLNQSMGSASPAQVDPFFTQGNDLDPDMDLDATWVTVFGFPPAFAKFILDQFSQYGTVLHYEVSDAGNWMHIHYQSKIQARKALSKNTKIYNDKIQIGVMPCISKDVISRYRSKPPCSDSVFGGAGEGLKKSLRFSEDLNESTGSATTGPPLTQSFMAYRDNPTSPFTSPHLPRAGILADIDRSGIRHIESPRSKEAIVNGKFDAEDPDTADSATVTPAAPMIFSTSFTRDSLHKTKPLFLNKSHLADSGPTNPASANTSFASSPAKPGIRSLTAAYENASDADADGREDKGILSRTLNTLLGW